jgi:hypothetical protein
MSILPDLGLGYDTGEAYGTDVKGLPEEAKDALAKPAQSPSRDLFQVPQPERQLLQLEMQAFISYELLSLGSDLQRDTHPWYF